MNVVSDDSPPVYDGFYMPPEWAPHERCWMAWPCRIELWRDRLDNAAVAYAAVARAIAAFEPVTMLVPEELALAARFQLGREVTILPAPLDDSWLRDNGPTFLVNSDGGSAAAAWQFNAWGNKYHGYGRDAAVPAMLAQHLGIGLYRSSLVLEGGAFHIDEAGTLMATEPAILNANRNPVTDRDSVAEILSMYLGVRKIIWLPEGLVGDETDGHIDNLARFIGDGRVLLAMTEDRDNPHYYVCQRARERLAGATDVRSRPLEIIAVPLPEELSRHPETAVASYLNFYFANGAAIVPSFDVPEDTVAEGILREVLANREVVMVPAREIVYGGGGIHCITQQQPKPPKG